MPLDRFILAILNSRHGIPTVVRLSDGQMLPVKNISYGYDEGSGWAHVATNMKPPEVAIEASLFLTSEIEEILDPSTSESLWVRASNPDTSR